MLPVNYLPPEKLPSHQRDFPRAATGDPLHRADTGALLLLVGFYLMAMFAGIGVLGYLTAPLFPPATAVIAEVDNK